jgi:hypothetical protein
MAKTTYLKKLKEHGLLPGTKEYESVRMQHNKYLEKQRPTYEMIFDFIDKIERRRGWADITDCYGELLNYYEYIQYYFYHKPATKMIDSFEPNEQFQLMYAYLLTLKNYVDEGKWKIVVADNNEYIIKNQKELV